MGFFLLLSPSNFRLLHHKIITIGVKIALFYLLVIPLNRQNVGRSENSDSNKTSAYG